MITKASGRASSSRASTATTNRTIPRFARIRFQIAPPNRMIVMTAPAVRKTSSGNRIATAFPGSVSRSHVRVIAVMTRPEGGQPRATQGAVEHDRERTLTCVSDRAETATRRRAGSPPSFVDAAHDRVEGGHDRHGVGKEVAGQELRHRLEMDEARVVDLQPEWLVRSVADRIGPEEPARRFHRGPGPAGSGPDEARHLGHDRAVGHLLEALVDDPEALLDLLDAEEVARKGVAFGPRGDVEVDLRVDRVGMRPPDVERNARRPEVGPRPEIPQGHLAVGDAEVTSPADEDLVLVEQLGVRLELAHRAAHPVAEAAQELVVEVAVTPADPEVVEEHPLAGEGGEHL